MGTSQGSQSTESSDKVEEGNKRTDRINRQRSLRGKAEEEPKARWNSSPLRSRDILIL